MNLKLLNKTDDMMNFILENSNPAFANALRRTMVHEVAVMSIEAADVEENSSGLFDEMLVHRLGLIPLTFDPSLYSVKEDCSCDQKGCSKCEVVLVLEKQGPCVVKAGDFKSTAPDVKATDAEIPIVELLEGQRLKVEAIAQLGYGRQHAKWQAAIAGYKYLPKVKITSDEDIEESLRLCPANVFEKKDGKVVVAREENCILCMKCTEVSPGVKVSAKDDAFVFTVETVSGLTPEQILEHSLDSLEKRSNEFIKELNRVVK
ncbi:MAG: DNA-directed RNA polymerase subunit D [Candidatus Aenigmarchaeota archaeon]|nr:DNA-directed RNA polymerase subunit D [Candidatus Aenigmarchaeota archaeon]